MAKNSIRWKIIRYLRVVKETQKPNKINFAGEKKILRNYNNQLDFVSFISKQCGLKYEICQ